jgi:2'-5' RNA ligase
MAEATSPQHFRLFIAITIPDPIKARIKTTQDELRQSVRGGAVRWTRPDQFHLTLRFLGNVEAPRIEQLIEAVRQTCQSAHPLELQAGGVGFFPAARSPRVVWAGVLDREERLLLVQQAVQQATLTFTSEKPEAHFSGHITLGRIRDLRRQEVGTLIKAAERFSRTVFGEWTAHEIHIMSSQLSSQGAEHKVLAAVPFA